MASSSKRSWKLQEFVAHGSNVNCLALGHKSGRVLATGGDDKKVNLWAVGKPNCIMSLSGHSTPIECVRFNHTEELVCAGSQTGALKVWDLEAAKLVKTLTGHKAGISCIDFHPYGDFLASGSGDFSLKLWDVRRKGCIMSFRGHTTKVNSIKFSPDGQWIASSGEDTLVKVWDLRAGRVLHEFRNHTNSVTSVEFHPHEFLLASGGLDRTINFWDLENFQLVSSDKDVGAVKCLWFNPDGECLFTGVTDSLKIHGWEPARLFDTIPIGWGKVFDIATANNQLVGASFHLTNVTIYIVDLKRVQPFGGPTIDTPASPFSHGQSARKSFSKEKPLGLRAKTTPDVKTIEESTSGTDPEEDFSADITNINDYTEVFKPNRSLIRTPPLVEPFKAPESDADPAEPQILSAIKDDYSSYTLSQLTLSESPPHNRYSSQYKNSPPENRYSPPELLISPPRSLEPENNVPSSTPISRSHSNLEQFFQNRDMTSDLSVINHKNNTHYTPKYELQRQYSCKDVPEKLPNNINNNNNNGIKHSASEANINSFGKSSRPVSRKNSFSKHNRNSSIPNVSRIPNPTLIKIEDNSYKRPEPIKKYEEPTKKYGEPIKKYDEPVKKYEEPTKKYGEPIKKYDEPVKKYEEPTKKYGEPIKKYDEPVKKYDEPIKKYGEPIKKYDEPIKKYDEPIKKYDEPAFRRPDPPKPLRYDDYVPKRSDPVDIYVSTKPSTSMKNSPDVIPYVPTPSDRPIGLDLEEFLPSNLRSPGYNNRMRDMSEEDALDLLSKDHNNTMAVLTNRIRNLRMAYHHFRTGPDSKAAIDRIVNMKDIAVAHDILRILMERQVFWSLDICVIILPKVHELIQSRLEMYIHTGCEGVKSTLKNFSALIRSNMLSPCSAYSVDIPREERFHKCRKCYESLMDIRGTLSSKHGVSGEIGATFRELSEQLNLLCIDH